MMADTACSLRDHDCGGKPDAHNPDPSNISDTVSATPNHRWLESPSFWLVVISVIGSTSGAGSWANIEDHSQIVRFVSSLIANDFVGKVRARTLMGVVLRSYAGAGQQKHGVAPT